MKYISIATLTLNPAIDRTMYFDKFELGGLNRAVRTVEMAGSKGINVSRMLCACGMTAPAFCFCGGRSGDHMAYLLEREGIDCVYTRTEAETRINIKLIDSVGNCTEANESGGPVSEKELESLLNSLYGHVAHSVSTGSKQLVVLGGSIPHPVDKSVYNSVVKTLKMLGAYVILDCDGVALTLALDARPAMIKPNLFELSQLLKTEVKNTAEAVENCKKIFVEKSVEVLCTLGKNGAIFVGRDGVYTVTSPQIPQVRGFAGAGDSFLGAFLFMREKSGCIAEALRFASSAAAAKVECECAAVPPFEEMGRYTDKIEVWKDGEPERVL